MGSALCRWPGREVSGSSASGSAWHPHRHPRPAHRSPPQLPFLPPEQHRGAHLGWGWQVHLKCWGPQGPTPGWEPALHMVLRSSRQFSCSCSRLCLSSPRLSGSLSLCVTWWLRGKAGQILALSLPEIGKQLFRFSKQILFVCKWELSTQPHGVEDSRSNPDKVPVFLVRIQPAALITWISYRW